MRLGIMTVYCRGEFQYVIVGIIGITQTHTIYCKWIRWNMDLPFQLIKKYSSTIETLKAIGQSDGMPV